MKHSTTFLVLLYLGSFIHSLPIKRALIFGITGQDGIYLTEFLLAKRYEVHGVVRQCSSYNASRIEKHLRKLNWDNHPILHFGDITDLANVTDLIETINPDEIYNLAAQSNVKISFDTAFSTAQTNALGALNILEVLKRVQKDIHFFQATSSEMFGKSTDFPQNIATTFKPRSPYAIAKLYSHWITINYREAYGIFACSGILFNHESPLRPETFVTKKISHAVAKISLGLQDILYLGNIDVQRDWGYAKDYVEAMWLMLQQDTPNDYVIATGETHSVREFVEHAFRVVGIDLYWVGSGIDEKAINKKNGNIIVAIDPTLFRPTEINYCLGEIDHTYKELGWKAQTKFEDLVNLMVSYELDEISLAAF